MLKNFGTLRARIALRKMTLVDAPKVFPVAVIGATGVGKSKLAIEIAQRFDGVVVNADSMQIYEGLDIVTNKVTPEERTQAPHRLLDYVDPLNRSHTVVDFRSEALPVIDELLGEGKTPVICGGTMYYIESLLWQTLIPSETTTTAATTTPPLTRAEMARIDARDSYERLQRLDPDAAVKIHPNDKRKVLRALEVSESGAKMSELHAAQHREGKSRLRGPLRYPDAVMIWVESEADVLNDRLDRRVDGMLEAGMLREMLDFHEKYNRLRTERKAEKKDYTSGIFQSIGFKEFHDYLLMSEECKDSLKGRRAFSEGLELLKLHTKQYTKNQRAWIQNRFLKKTTEDEPLPPVYKLDSTDPSAWDSLVRDRAFFLLDSLRRGVAPTPEDPSPEPVTLRSPVDDAVLGERLECQACEKVFFSRSQFLSHQRTKKHRGAEARLAEERANLGRTLGRAAAAAVAAAAADVESQTLECLLCRRSFDSEDKLAGHRRSKKHKRKVRNEDPSTIGLGSGDELVSSTQILELGDYDLGSDGELGYLEKSRQF